MVKDPGTATGPGSLLPLNRPEPVAIEADPKGQPAVVMVRGTLQAIVKMSDSWRIDDEWWRGEISRRYFAVELENGARLTVFCDLLTGAWYRQQYTPPARMRAG